jgi:transposase-like protein
MNKLTLSEIGRMTEDGARLFLEAIRWPNGPTCPHCCSTMATRLVVTPRPGLFQCNGCRGQFTVTVGSIFEDSHIPLHKWVLAFALMVSSKKGISALQLQRNLGLGSYKSAWHMAHRIRHAMTEGPMRELLSGLVEVDETYVGPRKVKGSKHGRGAARKTIVVALVERGGRIVAKPVETISARDLKGAIREHVDRSATIITDELPTYRGIGAEFAGGHKTVKHGAGEYARDGWHVNHAEAFFSLFKRGVHGTFHHISKKHMHRYTNEFAFRWGHRKIDDGTRMVKALQATEGKRLMYRQGVVNG